MRIKVGDDGVIYVDYMDLGRFTKYYLIWDQDRMTDEDSEAIEIMGSSDILGFSNDVALAWIHALSRCVYDEKDRRVLGGWQILSQLSQNQLDKVLGNIEIRRVGK